MSELRADEHPNPREAYGWRNHYEHEEAANSQPLLVLIDDDHTPRPVTEEELEQRGLGHIVTSRTIPIQRRPSKEETILSPTTVEEQPPQEFTPDASIYLG